MSKETYAQAIRAARERYKEAMDGAAADVVYICRTFDKPRRTVCKEIAGDEGFNALDHRARKFEKAAGQTADEARRARQKEADRVHLSHAKNALKNPEQAAKVIASLPSQALEEVYHEARLVRAGEDRAPAARKAAKAAASAAVAPMKRAVAQTHGALCVEAIREATDDLRQAMEEDGLTPAVLKKIENAHSQFVDVLTEAALHVEGARA